MSQTRVGVRTDLAGAAPFISPLDNPNMMTEKTISLFDFLDDSRFYPTTAQFEFGQYGPVYNEFGGVISTSVEETSMRFRAWRDAYMKANNELTLSKAERFPIKPSRGVIYPTNESDQNRQWSSDPLFPYHKWEQIHFTLTSFGDGYPFMSDFNTIYHSTNQPIVMNNTLTMVSIRDAARRFGMNEMGGGYVTGDTYTSNGTITNELWSQGGVWESKSGYESLLLQKVLTNTITEEELLTLETLEPFAIDAWTKSEYYPDAWSNLDYVGFFNSNSYSGSEGVTNHPDGTTPFDVLGDITDITFLSYISHIKQLPLSGNSGEVIRLIDYDYNDNNNTVSKYFAWDPQNLEWSEGFYFRFIEPIRVMQRAMRDAKGKAKNELLLSMRPFTFAALHILDYRITKNLINGEV